jgi:nitric oxide reductase NorE protein
LDQSKKHIPGEAGIWVLIIGDLMIFTLFFLTFMYYRHAEPALFAAAQAKVNVQFGLTNTILLLTSSLLVASGVQGVRGGRAGAWRFFIGGGVCGLGFVVIKAFEYGQKISAGINLNSNDFFMLYFVFTGIHLVHVLLGIGVLTLLTVTARRPDAADKMVLIESGAVFWHLVDLLWLVLFALFYLMR